MSRQPIPLAPYPPPSLRNTFAPSEWSTVATTWTTALTLHLQLPASSFTPTPNLLTFLTTYLTHSPVPSSDAPALRHAVFRTLHRVLTTDPLPLLKTTDFLPLFARTFPRLPAAASLLESLWSTHEADLDRAIVALKRSHLPVFAVTELSHSDGSTLAKLFHLTPRVAAGFLAGDEFAERAAEGGGENLRRLFARALCEAPRANWSVVLDTLYLLTAPSAGEKSRGLVEKLAGMGVGLKLEELARGTENEDRVAGVVEKLAIAAPTVRRKLRRRVEKGKAVERAVDEVIAKVDSIRDLFPDLGAGFVRRCLAVMHGDVEAVTCALLEENLPAELVEADRSEELYVSPPAHPPSSNLRSIPQEDTTSQPPPPSTVSTRKNIYDNDDLDRLAPSTVSKLHAGRRTNAATADSLLKKSTLSKSHILSALAAFDSDEDERDDTYDTADVGGAVDRDADEILPRPPQQDDEEKAVWGAYQRAPQDFAREARGGAGRRALKEMMGWTDEGLEGWAVMLNREPERMRRLERRFADREMLAGGQQVQLERTSWRVGDEESERGRGRGRGRGPGRARGGMGRGGGFPGAGGGPPGAGGEGSSQPAAEARGRARNEHNKGRVGNHGRREGRAKKMARGFGGAPP